MSQQKKPNRIWLSSDTHFFHPKIIAICGRPLDYEEHLFKGLEEIPEDDTWVFLGDLSLGYEQKTYEKVLAHLPIYRKILIRGNHDTKSDSWYLDHGWDWVCTEMVLERHNMRIALSHKPLEAKGQPWYDVNIHGHQHNYKDANREPNQILYSSEAMSYRPILMDTLLRKAGFLTQKRGNNGD